MATITWLGGAGHFNIASLWSTGTIPGAGDIALVDASAGSSTITLDSTVAVAGLTLNDTAATLLLSGNLSLGGGSLDIIAGTLDVSGTLSDGTLLTAGGVTSIIGGDFAQVAVVGSLSVSAGTLEATGLARASLQSLTLAPGAQILFLDGESFSGQTIALAGGVLATDATDPNDGSLFFGPGTTITQAAAGTTARIGPDVASALLGLGTVVNEGLIQVTAGTLALDAEGGAFNATVQPAPFINAGTIVIGSGATVIDDTAGTVASLGSIVNDGGLLVLKGSLDNSTTTIDVAASGAFSNLRLANTVTGGVIVEGGGTLAVDAATLLGVTIEGTTLSFNALHLEQGATFASTGSSFELTALADAYGQLMLGNAEVLSDVTIGVAAAGWRGTISADYNGMATLGPSTVINIASGDAITLTGPGTMTNDAVVNVAAGGRLSLGTFAGYTAAGTINVAAGATVAFSGSLGISALGHVVGSGAMLLNQGTVDLDGGTLSAAGNANFTRFVNAGAVIDGTLLADPAQDGYGAIADATLETGGGVLDVNSVSFASAELRGAVELETNGTLTLAGNTRLMSTDGSGQGTIILNRQPSIYVVGAATSLQFSQSATLSDATVLLGGITTSDLAGALSAVPEINVLNYSTATFASSVLIVATTVNGAISGIGNQGFVVNHGTIAVESGADFFIVPYGSTTSQDFVSDGLITIAAGGTFDVATNISLTSLGSITGSGGLLRLDANNVGKTAYDNTGHTLTIGGASGAPGVELSGAAISGGTILNEGGRFTAAGGTLTNVTYVGPMHLTRSTDIYGTSSAPSLYFAGGTLETQALTIDAGGSLLLGADEAFVGATLSLAGELADTGHTLSFDAATTVTISAAVYMPFGHLLNAGTIVIAPGGSLWLNDFGATTTAEPLTSGVIVVENGGTFTPGVLNAGQTVELEAGGVFTPATRYDSGSEIVFDGPNTLKIARAGADDPTVRGFGVGDVLDLTGYEDGAVYATFNDGVPHGTDASITLGYDGTWLAVTRGGTLTIASIDIGAGYTLNGFTVTPTGPYVPYMVTDYLVTYAAPGTTPPSAPSIAGTATLQPTDDLTAIAPFSAVTLADPNVGAMVTATVAQLLTAQGPLSAPDGGTLLDGGAIWVDVGSVSEVQAALRGLVFTPAAHQVAPGQTVATGFTLTVNDAYGTTTDATTSVAAKAVEDPIQLSGVTAVVYASDDSGFGQPFHAIALSDPDNATFTATATLSSLAHAYFGSSYNATISSGGVFSTSGSLSTLTTALHDLVIYSSSLGLPSGETETVGVTMSITDGVSETVNATSTLVIVAVSSADSAGLGIVGATPGQTTTDQASITPFSSIVVVDKAVGTLDTVTVVMSDTADGTFSDALGGTVNGGTFTVSSTVDSTGFVSGIDNVLAALVFTPTRGQVALGQSVTTTFTMTASNTLGSTTDRATSVIATASGGQLAIDGARANEEFSDVTQARPFAGVTIFDTQITPMETATVTLADASVGTLTAGRGGTVGADGVFRVSGTKADVQAALEALGYTPTRLAPGAVASTAATISVSDGTLTATDATTHLIVVGSGTADYGAARFVSTAGTVSVGLGTGAYVLDLGTVALGAVVPTVTLGVSNIANGTADALNGTFSIAAGTGFGNSGFGGFSSLSAGGTVAVAGVTLDTAAQGTFSETVTLTPTDVNSAYTQEQAAQTLTVQFEVACFAAGTRIATPTGDVPVEALRVGEAVLGPWGERMPVRWLGHRRVDCARHPRTQDVWPVRVRANAFRPGVPARDLLLSPDHALFVAPPGMRPVLIPVRCLIDGKSVVQERRARVTYWHVELERHAVLLAEGLPCESYLDTGNRGAFANGGAAVQLPPDFAARHWAAHACAPQVRGGPALDWTREWLAARHAEMPRTPRRRSAMRR